MTKFATSVRFLVKEGEVDAFMNVAKEIPNVGEMHGLFAKTGDRTFVATTILESEHALIDARPKMIGNLDKLRKYLEEITPELGVTDPVSGPIFLRDVVALPDAGLDLLVRQ